MKLTKKKKKKEMLVFIKYSRKALLLCDKPFDLLRIIVCNFTLSSELQTHKICKKKITTTTKKKKSDRPTMSFSDTGVQPNNWFVCLFVFLPYGILAISCTAACLLHKYDFKNLNFSRF